MTVMKFKNADGSGKPITIGALGPSDKWVLRAMPDQPGRFYWEPL